MTRHYLTAEEIVSAYHIHKETGDIAEIAKRLNCSYNNVRLCLKDLSFVLEGKIPRRSHGASKIMTAARIIRSRAEATQSATHQENQETVQNKLKTSEERINSLFEELKKAISDWSYELVEEKTRNLSKQQGVPTWLITLGKVLEGKI